MVSTRAENQMPQCVCCNREPTLGEMLEEPIIQLIMARDGVARPAVEDLMDKVAISRTGVERQSADCDCASCRH